MKVKLTVILLGFLSLIYSDFILANCGNRCSPCGRPCGPYETYCQCTDPNAYNNPCLPPDKFCEAFGNVGAR